MTTHKDGWMLSRREFAAVPALVVGAAAGALAQRALLTAGEVIDRIKANLGVPWRGGPTDTFKSGDVDTPIAGIAATVMSTFDVIKRAAAARKNMVITHEPTYWLGNDDVRALRTMRCIRRSSSSFATTTSSSGGFTITCTRANRI